MGGKRCGHVWKMMSNILSEMFSEKSSELLSNYSIRQNFSSLTKNKLTRMFSVPLSFAEYTTVVP